MKTHVEFRSELFPPNDEDEATINPDRCGKRLADFLVTGLREKGFRTGDPTPEDWGWVVPIKNDMVNLWIGCGQYSEHRDGFLCFIESHIPLMRRLFRNVDTAESVSALQRALNDVLTENPAITGLKWWSKDEFNHPEPRQRHED